MNSTAIRPSTNIFDIDLEGETIVLTPTTDLSEFDFQEIETAATELLRVMNGLSFKNVVVDFQRTDYCGSTALGLLLRLWKRVRTRNGHMALCNVSEHELEILKATSLDSLWLICSSRDEAVLTVGR